MAWPKGKPRPRKSAAGSVEVVEAASAAVEHEAVQPESSLSPERLGELAKMLVDNPAFHEASRRTISDLVTQWENTPLTAREEREALYHEMRAIRALTVSLGRLKQAGKIASIRDERLRVA